MIKYFFVLENKFHILGMCKICSSVKIYSLINFFQTGRASVDLLKAKEKTSNFHSLLWSKSTTDFKFFYYVFRNLDNKMKKCKYTFIKLSTRSTVEQLTSYKICFNSFQSWFEWKVCLTSGYMCNFSVQIFSWQIYGCINTRFS